MVHDYGGYDFPYQLSAELARRGHRVLHLYTNFLSVPRSSFGGGEAIAGLEVRSVPMSPDYEKRKYSFVLRFLMNARYGLRLLRLMAGEKPEVVLSGNTPTEIQLPLMLHCKMRRIRFINWIQDFFSVAVSKVLSKRMGAFGRLLGKAYESADRTVIRRSDCSVLITDDFKRQLQTWDMTHASTITIHNWASIENFDLAQKNNRWAAEFNLMDKFVFLYAGAMGLKHDPSLLVELSRAFLGDPDVEIVVVSEGQGAQWLRAQAASLGLGNLRVVPFQQPEDLPLVLAAADVLVGLLEKDAAEFSVPSKVLTYLCAGRPVLLSMPQENLAAKMVRENALGYVAPSGEVDTFVDYARLLRRSPELCVRLGTAARGYAEMNFQIGTIADQFEKVLCKIV